MSTPRTFEEWQIQWVFKPDLCEITLMQRAWDAALESVHEEREAADRIAELLADLKRASTTFREEREIDDAIARYRAAKAANKS